MVACGPAKVRLIPKRIYGVNKMRRVLCLLVASGLVSACSECRYYDCIVSDYFAIRIESMESGESLLSGNNAPISEANFYANVETSNGLEQVNVNIDNDKVYTELDYKTTTYFYSALNKTDTIELSYSSRITECCGNIYSIESLFVNGEPVQSRGPEWEVTLVR